MFLAATSHPTAGANARRTRRTASLATMFTGAALFVLSHAPAAHAQNHSVIEPRPTIWRGLETWAEGTLVDVQVRVDGDAAPLYFAPGRDDRRYVQAFAGRNYSLVLRNNTGERVAVLLAVDGLNAVSGEMSNLRSDEQMYVLAPWQTTTIRGWRTNLDEVRRFVFVDERRSYAERTGQANSDMGWIRVLAFREQQRRLAWGSVRNNYRDSGHAGPVPLDTDSRAPEAKKRAVPAPTPDAAPPTRSKAVVPESEGNMARGEAQEGGNFPGTGWGERRSDPVRRVEFIAEKWATDHLKFRYEYASGLRAMGILPVTGPWRERLADRDSDIGFAQQPRW